MHCSAGCGRTGTLIALYVAIETVEHLMKTRGDRKDVYPDGYYGNEERLSIFGLVRRLREQRWNLVKTVEQYSYLYEFMSLWVKKNFK